MTASVSTESLIYSERTDIAEPTQEDVEEYAKRLGIDIQNEPELLYLARDGLKEPLPKGWKPVFDTQRQAWYYFHGRKDLTQWEHPIDNEYREKVKVVRDELAKFTMNKFQNFDPLTSRPPKSLPPLKRGGANLAPIKPAISSLGKLGGIRPAAEDLRQKSFNSNSLSNKTNNSANIIGNSLGHFGNNSLNSNIVSGGSLNSFKDTDEDDDDSVRVMRPRKSGLTLTGGGANFIKGSENATKHRGPFLKSSSLEGSDGTHESEHLAAGDSDKKPIKSILVNSLSRSKPANFPENLSELEGFSMNMEEMTDEEKLVISQLESSGGSKSKGNVKFNLDENTELKFELSGDDNVAGENNGSLQIGKKNCLVCSQFLDPSPNPVDRNGEDDTEEGSVPTGRNSPDESHKPELLNSFAKASITRDERGSESRESMRPFIEEYSEESIESIKRAMRQEMEAELCVFKEQLEQERSTRQEQIQEHLNETVAQFRIEKEETIRKMKKELETETASEIDKAKQELDCVLQAEVNEMSANFEVKLHARQKELEEQHKERISALTEEYRRREEDKLSQVLMRKETDDLLMATEKDFKRQKDSIREDHKQQISQMKEFHKSILGKLQAELLAEEEKLRQDHLLRQAEIVSQFEQSTEELRKKLLRNQKEALEKIQNEFEASKAALEKKLAASLKDVQDKLQRHKRSVSETNLAETCAEDELREMKGKYQLLENKYKSMEKELNQLSQEMSMKRRNSIGGISSPKSTANNKSDSPSPYKNNNISKANISIDCSETNQDSAHGSESHSDSNSSIYPSSDGILGHKRTRKYGVDSSAQSNRINAALQALDILKEEILELKDSNSKKSGAKDSPQENGDSPGKASHKGSLHSNTKCDSGRRSSSKYDFKGHHDSTISRKKSSSATMPFSSRMARVKVSSPSPPTHDKTTDLPHQPKFVSRSVSVVPQDFSGPSSDPISEDTHQKIVEDAKAFIRMQKNRLKDPSPITNSSHLILPTTKNNILLFDEKLLKSVSPRRPASLHLDLVSETESSGVSSLKDHRSSESKQLSKDISEICNSLISLDQQMKLMWSVVKDKQQPTPVQNDTNISSRTCDLSTLLPNTMPMILGGKSSASKPSSSLPASARKSIKPSTAMISPNQLLPSGSVPARHYSSLLSSQQNTSSHSQTVLEALRMSGLSRTRLDCTDLLKSLEEELKEFRATKHRLRDIQEKFADDDKSDSPRHNNTSNSNILAKTKDLQEWIKKY